MKTQVKKRITYSIIITVLTCLVLSIIVYYGRYFQNWLNSEYNSGKWFFIIGWFLLFAYYGICFFYLWQTNRKGRNYLFLFGIQFIAFAVYIISIYCFSAYILASISIVLSLISSFWLAIKLFKNKQYVLMSMIITLILFYFYCLLCGILYCSMEYGGWKD